MQKALRLDALIDWERERECYVGPQRGLHPRLQSYTIRFLCLPGAAPKPNRTGLRPEPSTSLDQIGESGDTGMRIVEDGRAAMLIIHQVVSMMSEEVPFLAGEGVERTASCHQSVNTPVVGWIPVIICPFILSWCRIQS